MVEIIIVFFFQAEDGIRDGHVTGVQTCALPISDVGVVVATVRALKLHSGRHVVVAGRPLPTEMLAENPDDVYAGGDNLRSEERRVGKECRCWWGRVEWKTRREGKRGEYDGTSKT